MSNDKKVKENISGKEKKHSRETSKKAKEKLERDAQAIEALSKTIGKNRSFAMTEAHKRLRTNVMFSFADEGDVGCRIIGVTSAVAHEGKSTTAVNLAYDLMKAGKKTLLIDADMRLSKIAKFLEIEKAPGLSNLLIGKNSGEDLVQNSPVQDGLSVIACGNIPPNPTELLSSKRFELTLDSLKQVYEYIILDLPPVIEVSDALIASKLVDGMIVVVRQEYVDKRLLDDTVHQLQLSGARIIGFVMTCAPYGSNYNKYKYKKYGANKYNYSKYYGNYGYKNHGYYRSHYYDTEPYRDINDQRKDKRS